MTEENKLKKIITYFTFFIIILFLINFSINYLKTFNYGSITVYSSSKDNISIIAKDYLTANKKSVAAGIILKSGTTKRLKPGRYILTDSNGVNSAAREVLINSRKGLKTTINLPVANGQIDGVGNINSNSYNINSLRLLYLDQSTEQLYILNSEDKLTQLNDKNSYSNIQWADSEYGIGQDIGGIYHTIDSNGSHRTNLPDYIAYTQAYKNPPIVSVSINRLIYALNNQTIYMGDELSGFHKIGTDSRNISLYGGKNKLATVYRSVSRNTSGADPSTVSVIDSSGKIITKNIYTSTATWSASGKYLALSSNSFGGIYDTDLNLVATIPVNGIGNFSWIDDDNLIFVSGNSIWKFTLSSGAASTLYTSPSSQSITNITINQDSSYIYFSREGSDFSAKNVSIFRLPLKNQTVNKDSVVIQNLFPWLSGRCLLSVTNFKSITVQYYDSFTEDDCTTKAKDFLSNNSISYRNINFRQTDVLPNLPAN
jgi:hypothetical protein